MGLDFGLVRARKGNDPIWDNDTELAYGRKSWELAGFFNGYWQTKYNEKLTLEKWNEFIEKLEPIADKLEDIANAFEIAENLPDDYPEFVFGDKEKKLIAEYELWYKRTWDDEPYLGYGFSTSYMISFWNAKDLVRRLLKGNTYDVYTIASY